MTDNLYDFTGELVEQTDENSTFSITPDQLPEGVWDPEVLEKTWVILNGHKTYLDAVLTFGVFRSKEIPYNVDFRVIVAAGNKVNSIKQS